MFPVNMRPQNIEDFNRSISPVSVLVNLRIKEVPKKNLNFFQRRVVNIAEHPCIRGIRTLYYSILSSKKRLLFITLSKTL